MAGSTIYDLMYRTWAPWDSVGVRKDLVDFLSEHRVNPDHYPRAIDLGCGTGANVVHLAEQGFESWGVDFSDVALRKAVRRSHEAGTDATFVLGDLTAATIDGLDGPFDLLIDFGTLDDLRGDARRRMAETVTRLSRPGSVFLEYCFFGVREELPWIGMTASKLSHIEPDELDELFGHSWTVEEYRQYLAWRTAIFVMTRR